jgi:putative transposase
MGINPVVFDRQSIRLRGYDYSQPGAYFITVCTHQRQPLFGHITDGIMHRNTAGAMVDFIWRDLPRHYPGIVMGEHIVMPDHFHGIINIVGALVGAQFIAPNDENGVPNDENGVPNDENGVPNDEKGAMSPDYKGAMNRAPTTLGEIVRGFKARCTRVIQQPVWQRNYYEHIIRDEMAYQKITEYIRMNPQNW